MEKSEITRKRFIAGVSAVALAGRTVSAPAENPRPFGAGIDVLSPRIKRLLDLANDHDVFPLPVKVAYDPSDLALPDPSA